MGLLMNHLSIDGKGRVVFDSGDVEVDEEDEQMREDGKGEVEAMEDLGDLSLIEKLQGMLHSLSFLTEADIAMHGGKHLCRRLTMSPRRMFP